MTVAAQTTANWYFAPAMMALAFSTGARGANIRSAILEDFDVFADCIHWTREKTKTEDNPKPLVLRHSGCSRDMSHRHCSRNSKTSSCIETCEHFVTCFACIIHDYLDRVTAHLGKKDFLFPKWDRRRRSVPGTALAHDHAVPMSRASHLRLVRELFKLAGSQPGARLLFKENRKRVGTHSTRTGAAVCLFKAGYGIAEVAQILGWKSVRCSGTVVS